MERVTLVSYDYLWHDINCVAQPSEVARSINKNKCLPI